LIAVAVCWIVAAPLVGQTFTPSRAPQNPAFDEYINNNHLLTASPAVTDGHGLGLIPNPIDFSYLTRTQHLLGAAAFPSRYDLRSTGKMTPVRDQGSCGDCWTFGTFGSMESALLPESHDFSENNLNNLNGFDVPWCQGGNATMSMAYLTRWGGTMQAGPVDESADPYNASYKTSPAGLAPQKHVQDVILIAPRGSAANNDALKNALMTYGAVQTAMYMDNAYYNSSNAAYYYNGSSYANHAVTLAGWDDNYSRNNFSPPAPGDGAFLIKNSWGTYWGQAGYFWVSYYDTRYAFQDESFVFVNSQPVTNYSRAYQYDPLGWITSYGYGSSTASFANVFTAVASEQLQAVAFYVASDGSPYTVKIYTGVSGTPTSGTLASTTTGSNATAGYHTVALAAPVALTAGMKFSVVVTETTPGTGYPIPAEVRQNGFSSAASASSGQSYISPDGVSWSDLSADGTTNVGVKAFTTSGSAPDLTITKTHAGNFTQGQVGATYSITVRNSGTASTSGTVTVSDTLPTGLTATSMAGPGWICTQPAGPCTRSDALASGTSYAAVTVTVNVAANAPVSVINNAAVSGGGEINTGNDQASDPTTIAAVSAGPDVLTAPVSGSLLSDPPVSFCWTNYGNYIHWLDIGTSPGVGDLYGWAQAAGSTCKTITDPGSLLGNGGTVYVTVRSLINGAWNPPPGSSGSGGTGASYTAPLHTFWPLDNTVFTSSSVTFSWAAVPGATKYWLDVGLSQGNGSIFGGYVTGTSQLVPDISPTGVPIWVRLWAYYSGALHLQSDHSYTACDHCVGAITSPLVFAGVLPGSIVGTLPGSSATFCWSNAAGADAYWLDVGTMQAQGNLYAANQGLNLCQTVSGIPTTGIVYVQVTTHINGDWKRPAMQYQYLGTNSTSKILSPAPGSTLSSSTVTFSWNGIANAQGYWLDVGTAPGQGNLYAGYQGTATSHTVSGLPTGTIWVRLWTYYGGIMVPVDFQYTR
jgi:uncharacterized repeat protein (TIGR01451 family)